MDKLNQFGIPEDIQKTFAPVLNEGMFLFIWNGAPDKYLKALQKYGEDSFWKEVRTCFATDDPEQALNNFQKNTTERDMQYFISALKRSVSFLKNATKKRVEGVLS
jgi:hypothetical protein